MNQVLEAHRFPSGQVLQLVQGDLTQERVDAIVNAANTQLQHGGGVAGVIVRRGGAEIQAESNAWVLAHGPVGHAEPAYTTAGGLPCRYVIHAVGPVWGSGDEDARLEAAVRGSLRLADRLGVASIAFPAISTGIYGFPKQRAAGVIFGAILSYFTENPASGLTQVRMTLFDMPSVEAFRTVWEKMELVNKDTSDRELG